MSQHYSGYISVVHGNYNEWKNATLDNFYDVDGYYGYQCWDYISLFYYQVGFPAGYPTLTNSLMYTMWTNRLQNISYGGVQYFDLITSLADVKQGDIMVFNASSANPFGHAGFATQDYSTWDSSDPEFPILSQNNGGTPDPAGGTSVNIHGYDTGLFMGAFRYRNWIPTPPPTPISHKTTKSKFPFVLYANKLRNNY